MDAEAEHDNGAAEFADQEAVEHWLITQPDPRGGRPAQGQPRGLESISFMAPASATGTIEQTLKYHSTGVIRSGHAVLWHRGGPFEGWRELRRPGQPLDDGPPDVVPVSGGDTSAAVVIRQEVQYLTERKTDLRRDVESLEERRRQLQNEIDRLSDRHTRDMAALGGVLENVLAHNARALKGQLDWNNGVIDEHRAHAAAQLRGAWELEAAQQVQRSQITREIAGQAEDIGKIREQLRGSLFTDRIGEVLDAGRRAFSDALNSPIGEAIQLRIAVKMQAELEAEGQKMTKEQILDAMCLHSRGTKLRITALRQLANTHANEATARDLAWAASWIEGDQGNDARVVSDYIHARAKERAKE